MRKYTEEYLADNNLTNQNIIDWQIDLKNALNDVRTSKYIMHVFDLQYIEAILPVICNYKFELDPFNNQLTIYLK